MSTVKKNPINIAHSINEQVTLILCTYEDTYIALCTGFVDELLKSLSGICTCMVLISLCTFMSMYII